MYKNYIYLNKFKTISDAETEIENFGFRDMFKLKKNKNQIVFTNPEMIVFIEKDIINFLIYDFNNYKLISNIKSFIRSQRN